MLRLIFGLLLLAILDDFLPLSAQMLSQSTEFCVIAGSSRLQESHRNRVVEALSARLQARCASARRTMKEPFDKEAREVWAEAKAAGYLLGFWLDFHHSTRELLVRGILLEPQLQWGVVRILIPQEEAQREGNPVGEGLARLMNQLELAGAFWGERLHFWGSPTRNFVAYDVQEFEAGKFLPSVVRIKKKPVPQVRVEIHTDPATKKVQIKLLGDARLGASKWLWLADRAPPR